MGNDAQIKITHKMENTLFVYLTKVRVTHQFDVSVRPAIKVGELVKVNLAWTEDVVQEINFKMGIDGRGYAFTGNVTPLIDTTKMK